MLRKFNFFEKATVNDEKALRFFQSVEITCCTSGKGNLIVGDNKGCLHVIDRTLNVLTINAFKVRVNHMKHVKPNFVVAVGDDGSETQFEDCIKIFNLDKKEYTQGGAFETFQLVKVLRLTQGPKFPISPITVMELSPDFSMIALGLGNGYIVLFYGELHRGKAQMKVLQGLQNGKRITGMGFKKLGSNQFALFVTTQDSVIKYGVTCKGGSCTVQEPPVKLDETIGCESGCSTMSNEGDMVIATRNGIWFYKLEGKGQMFAMEGKKIMIDWYRTYLIIVNTDFNKNNNIQQNLTIYDLKNKFIAFKFFSEKVQISHIIHEWGSLFVIAKEKNESGAMVQVMYQLEEKDTQTKLETLIQKNLYITAISLVNSQSLDYSYLVEIYRMYGDHLYSKKDYDNAMKQYIKTIRRLEPSYVIRKFLDAQRIDNLTEYLEELHHSNIATTDHTTLLLNCYTKLKDVKKEDKLDQFIKTYTQYDKQTAIDACRRGKYYKYALLLAEKHKDHHSYIKILIEDFVDRKSNYHYRKALRYIESLEFSDAEKFMKEHGKILVTKLPKQTTNVLVRLCTYYFSIPLRENNRQLVSNLKQMKEKYAAVASKQQHAAGEEGKSGGFTELLSSFKLGKSMEEPSKHMPAESMTLNEDEVKRARPEQFIQAFATEPMWLIVFLENVIARNRKVEHPKIIYNTLIELYLQVNTNGEAEQVLERLEKVYQPTPLTELIQKKKAPASATAAATTTTMTATATATPETPSSVEQQEEEEEDLPPDNYDFTLVDADYQKLPFTKRILTILENPESNYDTEHILVLVQQHDFREGMLKMYEKLGLHYDIVQYYMAQGDNANVIEACNKYGESDPNLWLQVLSHFANANQEYEEEISKILLKIEKDNLLPPLLVVQILSKQKKTKLGTIKEYLTKKFQQDQMLIQEDIEKIKEFQTDTLAMRKEVFQLQTSAKIFQLTTCSSCNSQLDLPAVHFMCGHSYHHTCLLDKDECPKCMKKNRDVIQRKKKFEENSDQHELFFKQLTKRGADGFSVVSEYFGRGIFKPMSAETLENIEVEFDEEEEEHEDLAEDNLQ